jgi:hypothetical protein
MFKQFTIQGNKKWLKILPIVIDKYNNKIHSTINMTPTEASNNPDKIKETVMNNNYYNENNLKKTKPKFKLHQRVRIYKYRYHFDKKYTASWTNEVFLVTKIHNTSPITYELKDLEGEDIIGSFYTEELQAIDF